MNSIKQIKDWWKLNKRLCSPLGHKVIVFMKYFLFIVYSFIFALLVYRWTIKRDLFKKKGD